MTETPKEDLDPAVKAFLSRLDADDVPLLEKTIDITRKAVAFGVVVKWLFIGAFGLVVAVAALGESIQKIAAMVRSLFH